jgi:hypothetical protein
MRAAMEEGDAKLILHVSNVLAKRGLGDTELVSGLGKGPALDHLGEISQLPQIHTGTLWNVRSTPPASPIALPYIVLNLRGRVF